jgi:hypothetical protein
VGADGLHSGGRRLVFGEERQFRHFPGAYLAVYSLPDFQPGWIRGRAGA